MKRKFMTFFVNNFPDIKWLKKIFVNLKLKVVKKYIMPDYDVKKGENGPEEKSSVVEKYLKKWKKYKSTLDKEIKKALAASREYSGRCESQDLWTDMYFCHFAYGFQPDEYIFFGLEKLEAEQRKTFISDVERISIVFLLNDFSKRKLFNDKWLTYELLKPYFHRDAIAIEKVTDFDAFQTFAQKHPVFVKKEVSQACGQSVELIDLQKLDMTMQQVFDMWISRGKHILEEQIIQCEQMARFNASSLNTIRCVTLYTRDGVEVFPQSFMRNGQKGSFVDNGGAGGIIIGVNSLNGVCNTHGIDEGGVIYEEHPDTHVSYMGSQIPEWDKLLELCKEMALVTPYLKYASWDMAHTESGWVVVEANSAGQLIGQQMTTGRGIKSIMNEFLSRIDQMN